MTASVQSNLLRRVVKRDQSYHDNALHKLKMTLLSQTSRLFKITADGCLEDRVSRKKQISISSQKNRSRIRRIGRIPPLSKISVTILVVSNLEERGQLPIFRKRSGLCCSKLRVDSCLGELWTYWAASRKYFITHAVSYGTMRPFLVDSEWLLIASFCCSGTTRHSRKTSRAGSRSCLTLQTSLRTGW